MSRTRSEVSQMTMPHVSPSPDRFELSPALIDSLRSQLVEALEFHRSRLGDGTVDDDHDLNLAMQRRSLRALEETEMALDRMDEDLYGVCVSCQGAIATERLKAVPHALTCSGCART
ncbi:MAG: TraR/DksA family transcriptional regulator [Acidimicrobiia bacterium]